MKILLQIILFSSLICCNKSIKVKSKKINNFSDVGHFSELKQLPIGFTLGDYLDSNSILSLTESANIAPIKDENLKYFLTKKELKTAFETHTTDFVGNPIIKNIEFYPYERFITENFVVLIINKRCNNCKGRDYEFFIRTYTFEGIMIDNFMIAIWKDKFSNYGKGEFCGGLLLPDLEIHTEDSNGNSEYFKISENGKILKTLN